MDLSGVDDNEKNELKSTLYDNNSSNNNGACASSCSTTSTSITASSVGVSTGRNYTKRSGTLNSGNNNWNTNNFNTNIKQHQQNIGRSYNYHRSSYQTNISGSSLNTGTSQRSHINYSNNNNSNNLNNNNSHSSSSSSGIGSGGSFGGNKSRPKPTTWIKNRKFQPQSIASNVVTTYPDTVLTDKRNEHQYSGDSQSISNNSSEHHQQSDSHQNHQSHHHRNLNRHNPNARRIDSEQIKTTGKTRISNNSRRTNSLNSCYSTDTSIDNSGSWNDDDTNYGKRESALKCDY